MITCYTGTPGGGKSYASMLEVIGILRKGREVYTNMDGLDTDHCRKAVALVSGCDDVESRVHFLDKETVRHFWDVVTPGAVIVLDEVHKLWSSRTYASESNKAFAEWCSTHRHGGFDVILITQALDKLDGHVRSLIEWTHRCRKVNFVGSLVKRSYLEYVYSEDDERNCLSRKRHTYDPRIFKCYESYATKDIKEKGIGKATNILRHPVFYALPIVFGFMIYMLFFKSSFARGDILGSRSHIKQQEAAFHKAPVVLNKTDTGYFQDGKWIDTSKTPVEVKKDTPPVVKDEAKGTAPVGPGRAPVAMAGYVYRPPAKVVREGRIWRFIEQGSGREIGFVEWSDEAEAARLPRGRMSTAAGRDGSPSVTERDGNNESPPAPGSESDQPG